MHTYLETRINACGRVYGVVTSDEREMPFYVGRLDLDEKEVVEDLRRFKRRTDAIKYCASLALNWLAQ